MINETVKEIQVKLAELMDKFHHICQENGLTYYMAYGTMLGAVRHKGFIPWDDDVDVCMPRNDYETFVRLAKENLLEDDLFIKDVSTSEDIIFPYAMLIDKKTTIVYDKSGGIIEGVYIDIFPLDGAGNSKREMNRANSIAFYNYKKLLYSQEYVKRNNPFLSAFNLWVKNKDPYKIYKKLDYILHKKKFENSKYVGVLFTKPYSGHSMEKSIFGNPVLYDFEGRKFFGPEKYDEYLTNEFGDYMKLPPVEQRKSHHSFVYVNLDLPYEEYKKRENLKK